MKKNDTKNKKSIIYRVIFNWVTFVILLVFIAAYTGASMQTSSTNQDIDYCYECEECKETLNDVVIYVNMTSIEYEYYCRITSEYEYPDYDNGYYIDTRDYEYESYEVVTNSYTKNIVLSEYVDDDTRYMIKTNKKYYDFNIMNKNIYKKTVDKIINKSRNGYVDDINSHTILCLSSPKNKKQKTDFQIWDEGFKEDKYTHVTYPTVHTKCNIITELLSDGIIVYLEYDCYEYMFNKYTDKVMYLNDKYDATEYMNFLITESIQKEL